MHACRSCVVRSFTGLLVLRVQEEKLATDRISQVEASRQGLQQEILALEQLAELRRLNRRLLDKTAASDAALAFLKERRINEGAEGAETTQEWTEVEKDELRYFKAAREFDSDPRKPTRLLATLLNAVKTLLALVHISS